MGWGYDTAVRARPELRSPELRKAQESTAGCYGSASEARDKESLRKLTKEMP